MAAFMQQIISWLAACGYAIAWHEKIILNQIERKCVTMQLSKIMASHQPNVM
jgi:hypothetical protein